MKYLKIALLASTSVLVTSCGLPTGLYGEYYRAHSKPGKPTENIKLRTESWDNVDAKVADYRKLGYRLIGESGEFYGEFNEKQLAANLGKNKGGDLVLVAWKFKHMWTGTRKVATGQISGGSTTSYSNTTGSYRGRSTHTAYQPQGSTVRIYGNNRGTYNSSTQTSSYTAPRTIYSYEKYQVPIYWQYAAVLVKTKDTVDITKLKITN